MQHKFSFLGTAQHNTEKIARPFPPAPPPVNIAASQQLTLSTSNLQLLLLLLQLCYILWPYLPANPTINVPSSERGPPQSHTHRSIFPAEALFEQIASLFRQTNKTKRTSIRGLQNKRPSATPRHPPPPREGTAKTCLCTPRRRQQPYMHGNRRSAAVAAIIS